MIQVTGAPKVIYYEGHDVQLVQEGEEPPTLLVLSPKSGEALVFPLIGDKPKQLERDLSQLRTGIHLAGVGEMPKPNGQPPEAA